MTGNEWIKINKLINAWYRACNTIGKGNMNWAVENHDIKVEDAKYLHQLYFKKLAAGNNTSDPVLSAKGMRRLNHMWNVVRAFYDVNYPHSMVLQDSKKYKSEVYEREPLQY